MAQRGRKAVGTENIPQIGGERPEAPDDLNTFQKELWTTVVDTKPADWFTPDTHEHLRGYCSYSYLIRELSRQLQQAIDSGDEIAEITKIEKVLSSMVAKQMSLARSMRITQQSMDAAEAARRSKNAASKPSWVS